MKDVARVIVRSKLIDGQQDTFVKFVHKERTLTLKVQVAVHHVHKGKLPPMKEAQTAHSV